MDHEDLFGINLPKRSVEPLGTHALKGDILLEPL